MSLKLEFHFFYASQKLQVGASRHFHALEEEYKVSGHEEVGFKFYELVDKKKDKVPFITRLYFIIYLTVYASFNKEKKIVTDLNPVFSIWNNIIVNINDLREFKGFRRHSNLLLKVKHLALRKKKLVAISTHTKLQLEEIGCKNVTVIPPGVKRSNIKKYKRINKDIDVLVVGQYSSRKNHMIVMKAMEKINSINDKINAVFVGAGGKEYTKLHNYKTQRKINCVKLMMNISDKKLDELYQRSKILIIPTFYEGFGIPAVEGYAYNCEVLLSDYEAAMDFNFNYDLISNYNVDQVYRKIYNTLKSYDVNKFNDMKHFNYFFDDIYKKWIAEFL